MLTGDVTLLPIPGATMPGTGLPYPVLMPTTGPGLPKPLPTCRCPSKPKQRGIEGLKPAVRLNLGAQSLQDCPGPVLLRGLQAKALRALRTAVLPHGPVHAPRAQLTGSASSTDATGTSTGTSAALGGSSRGGSGRRPHSSRRLRCIGRRHGGGRRADQGRSRAGRQLAPRPHQPGPGASCTPPASVTPHIRAISGPRARVLAPISKLATEGNRRGF